MTLPYLVLLQVGFTLPLPLPTARCALTAPFHPYRSTGDLGGLFSVALSVGSRLPGVTWHPALWSPDFPPPLSGGCLANSLLFSLLFSRFTCKGVPLILDGQRQFIEPVLRPITQPASDSDSAFDGQFR
jgi:hypothetical protein